MVFTFAVISYDPHFAESASRLAITSSDPLSSASMLAKAAEIYDYADTEHATRNPQRTAHMR